MNDEVTAAPSAHFCLDPRFLVGRAESEESHKWRQNRDDGQNTTQEYSTPSVRGQCLPPCINGPWAETASTPTARALDPETGCVEIEGAMFMLRLLLYGRA